MPRLAWIDRTWSFDSPVDLFPSVVERLRGTPARLEEALAGLSREAPVRHAGRGWSVQENAGHLLRFEALPAARLDDFLAAAETLTPWTGNDADDRAEYDEQEIGAILRGFRDLRLRLVARLEGLAAEDFARTSRPPEPEHRLREVLSAAMARARARRGSDGGYPAGSALPGGPTPQDAARMRRILASCGE